MLNYTDLAEQVTRDLVRRVPEFRHIDPDRLAVLAAARCTGQRTGNLANCCSLRNEPRPTFSIWTRRGTRQVVAVSQWFQTLAPRVRLGGRQRLYMIQLRLPRMLLSSPLETIVHELYHIGERFDGRMRPVRHGAYFDSEVRRLMQTWLAAARGDLPRLAQMTFAQLVREFGSVVALSVPNNFRLPYTVEIEPPESYESGLTRLYPGYRLAAGYRMRRVELAGLDSLQLLTDRDLVLRHYDRNGVRRLPDIYARYARTRGDAISA